MSKVIFKLGDSETIYRFVLDLSKEEIENEKIFRLPLNDDLKEKLISKKLNNKEKNELKDIIALFIEKNAEKMQVFLGEIRQHWDNAVSDIFFKEMEKLFNKKTDDVFTCYLTNILPGIYFDNNMITVPYHDFYENDRKYALSFASFILAEEIVHLIYYGVWQEIFNKNMSIKQIVESWPKSGLKIWRIGEIVPEYIIVENEKFRKFGWDKINRVKSYPWITDFRKISDGLWKKRKSFVDFVINIHKCCNCTPT